MNTVYQKCYLIDGEWDGRQIIFSLKRYIFNRFVAISMIIVSTVHLVLFLFNNEFLLNEFIFFNITDGKALRICNLGVGLCIGSLSNLGTDHSRDDPKSFKCLNFLFLGKF